MRKICIDLGAGSGDDMKGYYGLDPDNINHEIFAFEANPHRVKLLEKRYPNVTVHNAAAGIEDGFTTFYLSRNRHEIIYADKNIHDFQPTYGPLMKIMYKLHDFHFKLPSRMKIVYVLFIWCTNNNPQRINTGNGLRYNFTKKFLFIFKPNAAFFSIWSLQLVNTCNFLLYNMLHLFLCIKLLF